MRKGYFLINMTQNVNFTILSEILSYLSPEHVHLVYSDGNENFNASDPLSHSQNTQNAQNYQTDSNLSNRNQRKNIPPSKSSFKLLVGVQALKFVRHKDPQINVYFNILQFYTPQAQYIGFKLYVEIMKWIQFSQLGSNSFGNMNSFSPDLISKVIPEWKKFIENWAKKFESKFTWNELVEQYIQQTLPYFLNPTPTTSKFSNNSIKSSSFASNYLNSNINIESNNFESNNIESNIESKNIESNNIESNNLELIHKNSQSEDLLQINNASPSTITTKYPVTFTVEKLIHSSLSDTKIRILRNGFILQGKIISMGSTNNVNKSTLKSILPLLITWSWRMEHIFINIKQAYQFFENFISLIKSLGVNFIICTDDPTKFPAVVQCFHQYDMTVVYSEGLNIQNWIYNFGDKLVFQSLNQIEQLISLLNSIQINHQDSNINEQNQHHINSEQEKNNISFNEGLIDNSIMMQLLIHDEISIFILETIENNQENSMILVYGSNESQILEVYQEIYKKVFQISTFNPIEKKYIQLTVGDFFFEGCLILYLRKESSKQLTNKNVQSNKLHNQMNDLSIRQLNKESNLHNQYNSESIENINKNDQMFKALILSKLNQLLANILEEDPINCIKKINNEVETSHILKEWYIGLKNIHLKEDKIQSEKTQRVYGLDYFNNYSEKAFLSLSGLKTQTTSIQQWKEKYMVLQSIFELLMILLHVRIVN